MRLSVREYGLSEDRLYATAFMLYLAGLFGWLAWTTLRGARRRFAFGGLVQGFAMLGVLHLVNPDVLIVRTNLARDRKSTRLNSSHLVISYAVFCLKKKK